MIKVTVEYSLPDWMYEILTEWGYDFEMNAWQQANEAAIELKNATEKKEE